MHALTITDFVLRLASGVGCGALIGLERQWRARMAGLRTNALVATGATLFVLYSDAVGGGGSPTRVASYVVSGIGFLGAGVILRDGFNIRGLNTAATLWCSAAVGVLAASGYFAFTGIATATVLAVHLLGRPLGRLIDHDTPIADEDLRPYLLHLICRTRSERHIRALLVQYTSGGEVILRGINATRADQSGDTHLTAHILLDGDAATHLEHLIGRLSLEPGIHAVEWHTADDHAANLPGSVVPAVVGGSR
ncbi:MgtC/SapB family protein [Microtetraspora sp. NBRC 16547]|uniref:MgtC/SapB family protein n=1 Tax=Microtetraspora sp. NBRC 16547 TaxID=3030993 RepID=UPI0024A161F2|nr:MgtC/SapB family protein [Microtetraspora sp. NBRC 16547]GLX00456.1 methyltransferase [Microtetraspora sp. NBRC 16547]